MMREPSVSERTCGTSTLLANNLWARMAQGVKADPNVTSASNASVQGSAPPLRKLCNLFETLRIAEVQMEVEASGLVWHMAYVWHS